ncbi:hypothetical protein DFH27DRAFT_626023, partial [Peziza echinospora]
TSQLVFPNRHHPPRSGVRTHRPPRLPGTAQSHRRQSLISTTVGMVDPSGKSKEKGKTYMPTQSRTAPGFGNMPTQAEWVATPDIIVESGGGKQWTLKGWSDWGFSRTELARLAGASSPGPPPKGSNQNIAIPWEAKILASRRDKQWKDSPESSIAALNLLRSAATEALYTIRADKGLKVYAANACIPDSQEDPEDEEIENTNSRGNKDGGTTRPTTPETMATLATATPKIPCAYCNNKGFFTNNDAETGINRYECSCQKGKRLARAFEGDLDMDLITEMQEKKEESESDSLFDENLDKMDTDSCPPLSNQQSTGLQESKHAPSGHRCSEDFHYRCGAHSRTTQCLNPYGCNHKTSYSRSREEGITGEHNCGQHTELLNKESTPQQLRRKLKRDFGLHGLTHSQALETDATLGKLATSTAGREARNHERGCLEKECPGCINWCAGCCAERSFCTSARTVFAFRPL